MIFGIQSPEFDNKFVIISPKHAVNKESSIDDTPDIKIKDGNPRGVNRNFYIGNRLESPTLKGSLKIPKNSKRKVWSKVDSNLDQLRGNRSECHSKSGSIACSERIVKNIEKMIYGADLTIDKEGWNIIAEEKSTHRCLAKDKDSLSTDQKFNPPIPNEKRSGDLH